MAETSTTVPGVPRPARVVERVQESHLIVTLSLELLDGADRYHFAPGQFNMLCVPGVGEVAISIISDPDESGLLRHTIRKVGRVTTCLHDLNVGDVIGLRGPYGRGWPVESITGQDLLVVTGGLGCAPVVSVINYIRRRRDRFGFLTVIQGVKHADDLIWREQYERWTREDGIRVLLAADVGNAQWRWHVGLVTELLDQAPMEPSRTAVMMCGPQPMMVASARNLTQRGIDPAAIWLSLERNMQCAVGWCGHCQIGPHFVCRDGPVFAYDQVRDLFGEKGF